MSQINGIRAGELPQQPRLRTLLRPLALASSGMSVQRARMEVISENIANAEVTRTEEGGPYRRRVVRIESAEPESAEPALRAGMNPGTLIPAGELPPPVEEHLGARVAGIAEDTTEGPLVYDPGHPDADANGYVRMPNVRITDELVDMMEARRLYEANASVFQAMKGMLRRALEI